MFFATKIQRIIDFPQENVYFYTTELSEVKMKEKKLSPLSFPIQKKFDFLRRMRHTPSNLKNYSPVSRDATRDGRCDALLCVTLSFTHQTPPFAQYTNHLHPTFSEEYVFVSKRRRFNMSVSLGCFFGLYFEDLIETNSKKLLPCIKKDGGMNFFSYRVDILYPTIAYFCRQNQ